MAEELSPAVVSHHPDEEAEVNDRGLFNFMGKEEEKSKEDVLVAGVEKIHIEEEEKPVEIEEENQHGLLDQLHRSHSSSISSSSDEEEGEDQNKEISKKKKRVKDTIKEKLHCDNTAELEKFEQKQEVVAVAQEDDMTVVVEKVETTTVEAVVPDEEKGFLEKINEKLHKKPVEETVETSPQVVPPPAAISVECGEHNAKEEGEKKSFLTKIKEKLPGYDKSSGDEGEKNAASE